MPAPPGTARWKVASAAACTRSGRGPRPRPPLRRSPSGTGSRPPTEWERWVRQSPTRPRHHGMCGSGRSGPRASTACSTWDRSRHLGRPWSAAEARLVDDGPDPRHELGGRRVALEPHVEVTVGQGEEAGPEVSVADPDVVQAAAVDLPAPAQQGEDGRVHQELLVAVRLGGAGLTDARPFLEEEIPSAKEGDVPDLR